MKIIIIRQDIGSILILCEATTGKTMEDITINRKTIKILSSALIACAALIIAYHVHHRKAIITEIITYLNDIDCIERGYVENIPTYEDYTTSEKESRLRRYLLREHLRAAQKSGIPAVKDDEGIMELAESGKLLKLESGIKQLYYFYNVRDKYRYLSPAGARGLEIISSRFQENIRKRGDLPPVKIAVSSAIRPGDYQRKVAEKNQNATIVSTHWYGNSIDIFYDDFYVSLPEKSSCYYLSRTILEEMRKRTGFMLGDSLRRQFRTVLMETVLQMQDEGLLYATHEIRQRCYHITFFK